jgi:hypothetical protein
MKTYQRAIGITGLFLATGCASTAPPPASTSFEGFPVPEGLTYRPSDSTIIETQDARAGRVVYRGRVEPASLVQTMRATLETAGWKLVGSTLSAQSGSTQLYDKNGTSMQVRIWEGGPLSWYTYVEMTAIGVTPKSASSGRAESLPRVVPAPGMTPAPSSGHVPSVSAEPASPGATIIR